MLSAAVVLTLSLAAVAPQSEPADEVRFWSARVARDPDDHISATRLGYACLARARAAGDFRMYAAAEEAFAEALKRAPGHYTALAGLATARAARHRFASAIELARQASAAQPSEPDAWAILGDAELAMGRLDAAEHAYAQLAARAPGFAADTRVANLLLARGQSVEAVARLRTALADAAHRELPIESRAWCHVTIGAALFDRGDWAAAEPEYQAALALDPRSAAALEHLAELRSYQGRDAEALALYERARAVAPRPEFLEAVGRTHARAGRPAEAAEWYGRARAAYLEAVEAGDPGYYRHLALFFTDVERRPEEAVRWARRDLELRPDRTSWSVLAWALFGAGDLAAAREAAAKATATGAADAVTWFRAGTIERAAGRPAAARHAFQLALQVNPKFDGHDQALSFLREP